MTADRSLPRSRRLTHDLEYQAVYAARMKKTRGPIVAFVAPNQRPAWRLGLAVGRRVGNAVARNRVKRALREAFRHVQHDLPRVHDQGCDMVLSALPHEPLKAADYRHLVMELAELACKDWRRRTTRAAAPPPGDTAN